METPTRGHKWPTKLSVRTTSSWTRQTLKQQLSRVCNKQNLTKHTQKQARYERKATHHLLPTHLSTDQSTMPSNKHTTTPNQPIMQQKPTSLEQKAKQKQTKKSHTLTRLNPAEGRPLVLPVQEEPNLIKRIRSPRRHRRRRRGRPLARGAACRERRRRRRNAKPCLLYTSPSPRD